MRSANGTVVRLSAVASVEPGVRNTLSAGWYNKQPSVLLVLTKDNNANVIETVDRVYQELPDIRRYIPAGIDVSVLSDRTSTIRASIHDMQLTLGATVILVMMVVLVFLRRLAATLAAGVTVPLALAGTCAAMWAAGFSIDNLSLMALAVSVGFVVDDAIVMIENCFRNIEKGLSPMQAAYEGARQIGFTVISISISLIAAFIPLLFMGGVVGRVFREFSVTLAFAIVISTAVSLSVTPMICAHFVRAPPSPDATLFDRVIERFLSAMMRFYARTLRAVLHHRVAMLLVMALTLALTATLYSRTPKGYFPRDDTGLILGGTQASPDISFQAMSILQQRAADVVLSDPAVFGVGSSIGSSNFNSSVNRGSLFISLKPLSERRISVEAVINRLRPKVADIPGLSVFMFALQDVRSGARQADSTYQFTLWDPDYAELDSLGPDRAREAEAGRRHNRCQQRSATGRPSGQRGDRPDRGRAPGRAHPGHRQRAR